MCKVAKVSKDGKVGKVGKVRKVGKEGKVENGPALCKVPFLKKKNKKNRQNT